MLKQVVLEICDKIDTKLGVAAEIGESSKLCFDVAKLVAELRGAAKATQDQPERRIFVDGKIPGDTLIGPDKELLRAQEFQRLQEASKRLRVEEIDSVAMVLCDGGPMDGTTVPIPSGMPLGAFTLVGGIKYKLAEEDVIGGKRRALVPA